jgi:hypothetical protein
MATSFGWLRQATGNVPWTSARNNVLDVASTTVCDEDVRAFGIACKPVHAVDDRKPANPLTCTFGWRRWGSNPRTS